MKKKKPKNVANDKWDQLQSIIADANKALGTKGKIFLGNEYPSYDRVPTGILAIDTLLGGGIPKRRLTEFAGEDSSFKTTAALHAVAAHQKRGEISVWIAGEEFDRVWAARCGVDLNRLILVEGDAGDVMCETACTLIESQHVGLAVFDAYQSLGTEREQEAGVEQEAMGGAGAPQMWARVKRRVLRAYSSKANTAIIGISEVRTKIGGFTKGIPEPESINIKVLRHWRAISLFFKKGEPYFVDPNNEDKKTMWARQFRVKCKKNKTAPMAERASSFDFTFRPRKGIPFGVNSAEEVARLGEVYGLISRKGAWYEGYGIRAQGLEQFQEKLRATPETVKELYTDILHEATHQETE